MTRPSSIFPVLFLVATILQPARAEDLLEQSAGKPPTQFECRWAHGPVTLDGKADEPVWRDAQLIDQFYLPWLGEDARPSHTACRARLLWDRKYIYFSAQLMDSYLYADVVEHDGRTWNNDVFELFFKPAEDKPGYYEFQVNAANTRMDVFLPRRIPGGFDIHKADFPFDYETAVHLSGTLNGGRDADTGWSVEGRIAWMSFAHTGGRPRIDETWRFALCRYDYPADNGSPELSTCAPLSEVNFHLLEDYAPLRFVGPAETRSPLAHDLYRSEKPVPLLTSRVVGSPDPPKSYRARRAYPQLAIEFPICVRHIPGTDQLLVTDQPKAYQPSKLLRMTDDPEVDDYEVLMAFGGVAYDITFHPNFGENGYLYIGHQLAGPRKNRRCRVTRFTMQTEPPYRLLEESATTILEWPTNGHNGAAVVFGNDGMLYVTTGDGTSSIDKDRVGQRLDLIFSKVLRLDVDHPAAGKAYSVPADNPFIDFPNARPETWAYGLRNPWRISVDRRTGHIWVGSNGQDLWESVYLIEKGANYGWPLYEGSRPHMLQRSRGPTPISKSTIDHHHVESRSLTGGVVYYGQKEAELRGAYIYGDYATGKIWAVRHDGNEIVWHEEIADTQLAITGFGIDQHGELLITDHRGSGKGGLYHLERRPRPAPGAPAELVTFPRRLSDTGLFASVEDHRLQPGLIAYSVNAPGWHDGAQIERYLALPVEVDDDHKAKILPMQVAETFGWGCPERTVVLQTLSIRMDERDPSARRRVETRILTRQEGEWVGYSYWWNDQQTDAELVSGSGAKHLLEIQTDEGVRQQTWHVPSRAECMSCHSRQAGFVLGLSTLQLDRQHDYGPLQANQMQMFEYYGILTGNWLDSARYVWSEILRKKLASEFPKDEHDGKTFNNELKKRLNEVVSSPDQRPVPTSSLLVDAPGNSVGLGNPYEMAGNTGDRARAYLHANCGHCHVRDGGGNAKIELGWDSSNMQAVRVEPLHSTYGIDGGQLIAPGAPHRSILVYRLATLGGGRMPRLGSHQVDLRGLRLIQEWIAGLSKSEDPLQPIRSKSLTDEQLGRAIDTLLGTTDGALALLLAVNDGSLPSGAADQAVARGTASNEPAVRDLFERFLPEDQRVRRLGITIDPEILLAMDGDAERGRDLFWNTKSLTCRSCHQIQGRGEFLGPELTEIGKKYDRAKLLESILQPSRTIDDKFATYLIEADGRIYTGLLVEQSDERVVLKDLENKQVSVARDDLEFLRRSTTSLMPEHLLKDLTAEQAADLLAYLESLKGPAAP